MLFMKLKLKLMGEMEYKGLVDLVYRSGNFFRQLEWGWLG